MTAEAARGRPTAAGAPDDGSHPLDAMRRDAIDAHQAKDVDKARSLYAHYLRFRPDDATIWTNLGVLMRQNGDREQALRFQQRAARLRPDLHNIQNNLANSLGDLGRHEEALALFRGISEREPDNPNALWNVGRHLRGMGQHEAAIAELKAGRKRFPDEPEMQVQLALTQLAAGHLAQGFRNYDARFDTGEVPKPKIDLPRWKGQPLDGKALLVVHEQGLGDSLLCARFLPPLKAQGARVHFVCRPQVHRLLTGTPGIDGISSEPPAGGAFDYWTPMFDLPRYYFTKGAGIPGPARLAIPKASIDRADALARPYADRLRVAVNWTGSVTYNANHLRSVSHRAFLPLAEIPGAQLFSLYKGPLLKDYFDDASNALILDAASTDSDLADCAATITRMNLVITTDTAVAHLAGSLGAEVWCLLHWDPFWLYGHSSEWTSWYPKMRLYRQRRPMDWDDVLARVAADLEARVRSGGGGGAPR